MPDGEAIIGIIPTVVATGVAYKTVTYVDKMGRTRTKRVKVEKKVSSKNSKKHKSKLHKLS